MIHDWVGSRLGDNRDMGNLRYAALDPVFNLHHANIDWIWSRYPHTPDPNQLQPETNCAQVKDFETWLAKEFTFLDTDGKMKTVTVKDTLTKMSNVKYLPPAGTRRSSRRSPLAPHGNGPSSSRSRRRGSRTSR